MAEEAKTEAPTPRRQEEVRRRGQVGKSQEIPAALVILTGLLMLKAFGGSLIGRYENFMRASFQNLQPQNINAPGVVVNGPQIMLFTLELLLPILLGLAFVSLMANLVQTGFVLSGEPLRPKLERLNPMMGLKRIFSLQGLALLVKSLAKVAIVALVIFLVIRDHLEELSVLSTFGLKEGLQRTADIAFEVVLKAGGALLLLALADYAFQRREFLNTIRMTKQEVKDELRQTEGDPRVRARMRRVRQQFLQRTMQAVPRADLVVTNPTHLAVALKYDPLTMSAPKVIAKGQRLLAERIKKIAQEHQIPIVENPPLAQALFKMVQVGREIPTSLYQAVAEVLAFVYRLRYQRQPGLPIEAGLAAGRSVA